MRIDGVCQCALSDREAPVSGLDAFRRHFQADFRANESCFFSFVVVNLLKTRQFRPKRNRPKKRFSGFDTPSKCVSPNVFSGFVKSTAQKTGEVQYRKSNSPAPHFAPAKATPSSDENDSTSTARKARRIQSNLCHTLASAV